MEFNIADELQNAYEQGFAEGKADAERSHTIYTDTPTDLISRQAAIEALTGWQTDPTDEEIEHTLKALPVEPVYEDAISKRFIQDSLLHRISNLNAQGEKAIDIARELIQFKKFVDGITPVIHERPKGEWIEHIDDRNGRRYGECPSCHKATLNAIEYDLDGERHIMDFCPKCGADMRGNDYQRHTEDLEHFMRYEPTYNPEDGSM